MSVKERRGGDLYDQRAKAGKQLAKVEEKIFGLMQLPLFTRSKGDR